MAKRKVLVIGIGAGDPDHLTLQAVAAMNRASVFFIPDKGAEKADLHRLRREICARHIEGDAYRLVDLDIPERAKDGAYRADVRAWRAEVRAIYERLLAEEMAEDAVGAFLVWGDPSLYDGTMGILEAIRAEGRFDLDFEVIPGISSVSALAARHRVALNRIGEPLTITTGRQLSQGGPGTAGNVVVMLDSRAAFRGVDQALHIHWGGNIGTEGEVLVSGPLREVAEEIDRLRDALRAEAGWVMDTYMLSSPPGEDGDGD